MLHARPCVAVLTLRQFGVNCCGLAYSVEQSSLSVADNRRLLSVTVRLALRLAVTVLGFLLLVLSDRPDADYD